MCKTSWRDQGKNWSIIPPRLAIIPFAMDHPMVAGPYPQIQCFMAAMLSENVCILQHYNCIPCSKSFHNMHLNMWGWGGNAGERGGKPLWLQQGWPTEPPHWTSHKYGRLSKCGKNEYGAILIVTFLPRLNHTSHFCLCYDRGFVWDQNSETQHK